MKSGSKEKELFDLETHDSIPTRCVNCSSLLGSDCRSILLLCKCLVGVCQTCAKSQIENHNETYRSFIKCYVCGEETHLTNGIVTGIDKASSYEDKLLTRAFRHFKINQPRKSSENTSKFLNLLDMFTNSSRLLRFIIAKYTSSTHVSRLKLLIARLELLRDGPLVDDTDFPLSSQEIIDQTQTELPDGPLYFVKFVKNHMLEQLLSLEDDEIDIACNICCDMIEEKHSILVTCNCNKLICRSCAVQSVISNPQTYYYGYKCPFCRSLSPLTFTNIEEIKTLETKQLMELTRYYTETQGKKIGIQKYTDLKELHSFLFAMDLTPENYSFPDNPISLYQLRLELVRLYSIYHMKTKPQEFPMGLLNMIQCRQNPYLEMYLKYGHFEKEHDVNMFQILQFQKITIDETLYDPKPMNEPMKTTNNLPNTTKSSTILPSYQPTIQTMSFSIPVIRSNPPTVDELIMKVENLKAIHSTPCTECSIDPYDSFYLSFHLWRIHNQLCKSNTSHHITDNSSRIPSSQERIKQLKSSQQLSQSSQQSQPSIQPSKQPPSTTNTSLYYQQNKPLQALTINPLDLTQTISQSDTSHSQSQTKFITSSQEKQTTIQQPIIPPTIQFLDDSDDESLQSIAEDDEEILSQPQNNMNNNLSIPPIKLEPNSISSTSHHQLTVKSERIHRLEEGEEPASTIPSTIPYIKEEEPLNNLQSISNELDYVESLIDRANIEQVPLYNLRDNNTDLPNNIVSNAPVNLAFHPRLAATYKTQPEIIKSKFVHTELLSNITFQDEYELILLDIKGKTNYYMDQSDPLSSNIVLNIDLKLTPNDCKLLPSDVLEQHYPFIGQLFVFNNKVPLNALKIAINLQWGFKGNITKFKGIDGRTLQSTRSLSFYHIQQGMKILIQPIDTTIIPFDPTKKIYHRKNRKRPTALDLALQNHKHKQRASSDHRDYRADSRYDQRYDQRYDHRNDDRYDDRRRDDRRDDRREGRYNNSYDRRDNSYDRYDSYRRESSTTSSSSDYYSDKYQYSRMDIQPSDARTNNSTNTTANNCNNQHTPSNLPSKPTYSRYEQMMDEISDDDDDDDDDNPRKSKKSSQKFAKKRQPPQPKPKVSIDNHPKVLNEAVSWFYDRSSESNKDNNNTKKNHHHRSHH